jgi:WD40 repeat protein
VATVNEDGVLVWPRDGSAPIAFTCETPAQPHRTLGLDVDPRGRYLAASRIPTRVTERLAVTHHLVTLWSIQGGRALRTWRLPAGADPIPVVRGEPPHVDVSLRDFGAGVSRWVRCTLDSDEVRELGTTPDLGFVVTRDGRRVLYAEGNRVKLALLDRLRDDSPVTVGRHEHNVANAIFDADEDQVASVDAAGRVCIWSLQEDGRFELAQDFFSDASAKTLDSFDPANQHLVYSGSNSQTKCMLALAHPEARPVAYVPDAFVLAAADFTPDGDWLGFAWCDERLGGGREYRFYSTARSRPQVHDVLPENDEIWPNFFLPDGSTLVARNNWEELVLCQVSTREPALRSLWRNPFGRFECAVAGPDNRYVGVNNWRRGRALVIPVDGSEPIVLDAPQGIIYGIDIEAGNRRVAVSGGQMFPVGLPDLPIIDVHDLQTGTKQVLRAEGECGFFGVGFLPEDRLFSYSHEGLLLWDLRGGNHEVLSERKYAPLPPCGLDAGRRFLLVNSPAGVTLWDLRERTERILPIPTEHLWPSGHSLALSPDASFVVAGMDDGAVLVFPSGFRGIPLAARALRRDWRGLDLPGQQADPHRSKRWARDDLGRPDGCRRGQRTPFRRPTVLASADQSSRRPRCRRFRRIPHRPRSLSRLGELSVRCGIHGLLGHGARRERELEAEEVGLDAMSVARGRVPSDTQLKRYSSVTGCCGKPRTCHAISRRRRGRSEWGLQS